MRIIDHGKWEPYIPEKFPPHAPKGTMFVRRKDGKDWYEYMHPVKDGKHVNFHRNSVKMTCLEEKDEFIVMAASVDPTMLFPSHQIVIELVEYSGKNPQEDFGGKVYKPDTQEFVDRKVE